MYLMYVPEPSCWSVHAYPRVLVIVWRSCVELSCIVLVFFSSLATAKARGPIHAPGFDLGCSPGTVRYGTVSRGPLMESDKLRLCFSLEIGVLSRAPTVALFRPFFISPLEIKKKKMARAKLLLHLLALDCCVLAGAQENRFPLCVDAVGGRGGVRGEGRQQHRLSELVPHAHPRVSAHGDILQVKAPPSVVRLQVYACMHKRSRTSIFYLLRLFASGSWMGGCLYRVSSNAIVPSCRPAASFSCIDRAMPRYVTLPTGPMRLGFVVVRWMDAVTSGQTKPRPLRAARRQREVLFSVRFPCVV